MANKLPDELWVAICAELYASDTREEWSALKQLRQACRQTARAADVYLFRGLPLSIPISWDWTGDSKDARSHAAKWLLDCEYVASGPRAGNVQKLNILLPLLVYPDYKYMQSRVDSFIPRLPALKTLIFSQYMSMSVDDQTGPFLAKLLNRTDVMPKLQEMIFDMIPNFGPSLSLFGEFIRKIGQLRRLTMQLDCDYSGLPRKCHAMIEMVQAATLLDQLTFEPTSGDAEDWPLIRLCQFGQTRLTSLVFGNCCLLSLELSLFLEQNRHTLRDVTFASVDLQDGRWENIFESLQSLAHLRTFSSTGLMYPDDVVYSRFGRHYSMIKSPKTRTMQDEVDQILRSSSWLDYHALADFVRHAMAHKIGIRAFGGQGIGIESSKCLQLCSLADARADAKKIGKFVEHKCAPRNP